MTRRPRHRRARRQRGVSLIEVMVSITLGLAVLAVLTTLFVNEGRARTDLDRANRLVENGRYAMEQLTDGLHMAGYYGELDPVGAGIAIPDPTNTTPPDPCPSPATGTVTATSISSALRLHVQGYNSA